MAFVRNKYTDVLIRSYYNALLLDETKRRFSRATTNFRGRDTLQFLYDADGDGRGFRTQSEIADHLRITRPSCTVLVKKLESMGYVTRSRNEEDERSTQVRLTRRGRLITAYHIINRQNMVGELLSGFTEEEQEIIYRGFVRLNKVFEDQISGSERGAL